MAGSILRAPLRAAVTQTGPSTRWQQVRRTYAGGAVSIQAPLYQKFLGTLEKLRDAHAAIRNRPLTLAEKILYSHLRTIEQLPVRGSTYLKLAPDRVAMQDASAQMALLQFMLSGLRKTAVPTTVHCDHLIAAQHGADADLKTAIVQNDEIFGFLQSASQAYGIGFWKPGSGIIHQIVLENYAAPGTLMLGTDSHTPNAGGLGMLAIGVGGADAVDAMADLPWELKAPKIIGVELSGSLSGWTSPKDVILHLAGLLTVQGGTNHIIEYFGPGVDTISCTGLATICNMGAEVGATTSVFPYTAKMGEYLRATRRSHVADAAERYSQSLLSADKGAEYDKVISIDLSKLEPHINGPFTPDAAFPISQFKNVVKERNYPSKLSAALIGSCTNSSYEDMSKAASVASQAAAVGLKVRSEFLITPGSEQIRATVERDGIQSALQSVGGRVLANACGPCIGQWIRNDVPSKEANSIVTSFNRNFRQRNDGNPNTMNFLASPEIVTAMAFAGDISFNPATDAIPLEDGTEFRFSPPVATQLPFHGFDAGVNTLIPPSEGGSKQTAVDVSPNSKRLQLLEAFPAWDGKEIVGAHVLVRVTGKCTTDHISAAGPWLKYKGHLENISENTLIGATNEHGRVNEAFNVETHQVDTIPNAARALKRKNIPWLIIADSNYGEGSAREHAAMQPRFLGCKVIVAKSFARIHETNLKKQGVLPLTFADAADYSRIHERSLISTEGLVDLAPGQPVYLHVQPSDRSQKPFKVKANHTLSDDQIAWIRAGSALNMIAASQRQHQ